ncbi:hypothetical protein KUTeg_007689 [Tegillarca granosa]|uniref:Mutator-like transposase domain-containing protein n=1 Tax=Tegillarca granosa TaxID=220873 RepID=A0ABQ9FE20_TEGGR|nr:hypothetical protein KUTeg_007689 [Tegillarca granosa]
MEMLITGMEERQIAVDKENYHEDIPYITVVTDGGWCKRTHKHSYNVLGGVAIIIGKETKTLLHIVIRNWHESSQAMEAAIIVKVFKLAESKHGLRYTKVLYDGDSSVYARIREEVAIWGRDVEKLDCANHVCKCLGSNLEKLITDNPLYKGKHHLSKSTRVRLSAVRCTIRMRTKQANCSNFCKSKLTDKPSDLLPPTDTDIFPSNCIAPEHGDVESVSVVLDSQIKMWTDGKSLEAQEESRNVRDNVIEKVENFIMRDVSNILKSSSKK